jgi:hypothetical protein
MGFITPVITTGATPMVSVTAPVLSVSAPTITYNQFLNSLGTYNYGSEYIYLSAKNFQQIAQVFNYQHFDSNGDSIQTFLPFTIDPYQKLPSKYYETNSEEIVFDGFSSMTFNLLANEMVYFKMFADIIYMSGDLDEFSPSNMQTVEELEGIYPFFSDYCNYIIDKE